VYGTSAALPAVAVVHVDAAGATPPVVARRWTKLVFSNVPGVVEAARRSR
jgi:hypothetical protein